MLPIPFRTLDFLCHKESALSSNQRQTGTMPCRPLRYCGTDLTTTIYTGVMKKAIQTVEVERPASREGMDVLQRGRKEMVAK
ncbi:hypothetical protein VTK73DRAFT_3145 [Phialemonium thermophilum]|uniref:Uncharacterized protein n=1 Tax=Phialemonium thermophilum TaxID=223376 RepID=A0ABR3X156_9PEZI